MQGSTMESAMKSPFPGMDPYLEARWSDVHAKLVGFIGEALQARLPRALRARSEERVFVEEAEDESRWYRSDVAVVDAGRVDHGRAGSAAAVAPLEPLKIRYYNGPVIDRFIHIIDVTSGNRVITAIEILSPWNKAPGRLNKDYHRKLEDYARGEVSLVEIDLLRDPPRGRLLIREGDIQPHRRTPYYICVRHGWDPDEWLVYPLPLRQPLAPVPVPLRREDAPVVLELQPLIERVYTAGGHDDIDYTRPANPPLTSEDAAWADELLKAARKR